MLKFFCANTILFRILSIYNSMSEKDRENSGHHTYSKEGVSVDLNMIYEISGNDETYIVKILQTFLSIMPVTLKRIEEAANDKNWEEVYKAAHYAKSSLSIIKVGEMHKSAFLIEHNAKNIVELQIIPGIINKMKAEFEISRQVITENLGPIFL